MAPAVVRHALLTVEPALGLREAAMPSRRTCPPSSATQVQLGVLDGTEVLLVERLPAPGAVVDHTRTTVVLRPGGVGRRQAGCPRPAELPSGGHRTEQGSCRQPARRREPRMSRSRYEVDPGLRRAGRLLGRLTPSTPGGFRRQVRVMNALARRRHRPGRERSQVRGDIEVTQRWTPRRDGSPLRLLVVRPAVPRRQAPGVLWIHGGGYALGTPEQSLATARRLVTAANAVVVLPDYRLSVQAPYPAALDDCYDALLWLRDSAGDLGVADDQLVVGGESAGGGLTAAVTLVARDRGEVAVAFQVPLYPMIDDRPTASSRDNTTPVWNTTTNTAAWDLYLGDLRGGDVPASAAPARATDLAGLPPTLTFVGDIEPFHDEVVDWCRRLEAAGVPVSLEVYRGAFHGFDLVAASAPISRKARAFLVDGFRDHLARHRAPQPARR
ncbi:alpha/beta hydrolase [Geodermatophilus telluris]|uniref:alpha/beta hydrolase n=1 Tax=Geodermatophilus telluris TaxID=1190417 RepID=UPI001C312274|nr:alpha/beta hydrolase [Geodermatophilus telluris]